VPPRRANRRARGEASAAATKDRETIVDSADQVVGVKASFLRKVAVIRIAEKGTDLFQFVDRRLTMQQGFRRATALCQHSDRVIYTLTTNRHGLDDFRQQFKAVSAGIVDPGTESPYEVGVGLGDCEVVGREAFARSGLLATNRGRGQHWLQAASGTHFRPQNSVRHYHPAKKKYRPPGKPQITVATAAEVQSAKELGFTARAG